MDSFPQITALKNCAGVSLAQFLCLVLAKNNLISGCKAVFEVQIFSKGKVETRRKPAGFQGLRQSMSENLPSKTDTSLRKGSLRAAFFSLQFRCGCTAEMRSAPDGCRSFFNSITTAQRSHHLRSNLNLSLCGNHTCGNAAPLSPYLRRAVGRQRAAVKDQQQAKQYRGDEQKTSEILIHGSSER